MALVRGVEPPPPGTTFLDNHYKQRVDRYPVFVTTFYPPYKILFFLRCRRDSGHGSCKFWPPQFLRSNVNGNRKLITDWLDGSEMQKRGSHLLCIMLERLGSTKADLSGIAGGHVIRLFQTVPAGIWP